MQPSFFSKAAHESEGEDWFQAGTNVSYTPSKYSDEVNHLNPHKHRHYQQLSFEFQFMIGGDEVFCCYTVPYTYSEVLAHLAELRRLHDDSRKFTLVTNVCSVQVYSLWEYWKVAIWDWYAHPKDQQSKS